jgi:hypothetical protein
MKFSLICVPWKESILHIHGKMRPDIVYNEYTKGTSAIDTNWPLIINMNTKILGY